VIPALTQSQDGTTVQVITSYGASCDQSAVYAYGNPPPE